MKRGDIVRYVGNSTPEMRGSVGVVLDEERYSTLRGCYVSISWIFAVIPLATEKGWNVSNLEKLCEAEDAD